MSSEKVITTERSSFHDLLDVLFGASVWVAPIFMDTYDSLIWNLFTIFYALYKIVYTAKQLQEGITLKAIVFMLLWIAVLISGFYAVFIRRP